MRFRIVGEDIWREGKLVLENNTLIFYEMKSKQKKGLFGKIRGEKKGEEVLKINISSIKDVKRVSEEELILGYEGEFSGEEGSQLAYVQVRMRAEAINDLEREILMRMNAREFSVFFAQTLTEEMRLRKGILKLSPFALWLIDREGQKRIEWDVVVNVEEKKRGKYKGVEYAAISIEYIDEDSKVKSSLIISKGDIISTLKKEISEILSKYSVEKDVSDIENQILALIYAGAFDFTEMEKMASSFGISEEEMRRYLEHLSEIGMLEDANGGKRLTKRGIRYMMSMSKGGK